MIKMCSIDICLSRAKRNYRQEQLYQIEGFKRFKELEKIVGEKIVVGGYYLATARYNIDGINDIIVLIVGL